MMGFAMLSPSYALAALQLVLEYRSSTWGPRGWQLFLPDDGKLTDAKARTLDHRDTALIERLFESRKIGEEQGGLTQRPPVGFAPEKDDRRLSVLPQREQGSEIGVGGDHDPIFASGARENFFIGSVA